MSTSVPMESLQMFADAAQDVFQTMLSAEATVRNEKSAFDAAERVVMASVTYTGLPATSLAIRCRRSTAEDLARRFLGGFEAKDDETLRDVVGEITNMIGGGAKTRLNVDDAKMSCPEVTLSFARSQETPARGPTSMLACEYDNGRLDVVVHWRSTAPECDMDIRDNPEAA